MVVTMARNIFACVKPQLTKSSCSIYLTKYSIHTEPALRGFSYECWSALQKKTSLQNCWMCSLSNYGFSQFYTQKIYFLLTNIIC